PGCSRISQWLPLIRAGDALKSTRIAQLLRNMARGGAAPPSHSQDMAFFRKQRLAPDDWRRETVRRSFAANLRAICRVATKARVPVLLSAVPVNIKDFPPLGSLGDKSNAEERYRLGQNHLAAGDTNQARQYFEQALDWDALQFRADDQLNQASRDVP